MEGGAPLAVIAALRSLCILQLRYHLILKAECSSIANSNFKYLAEVRLHIEKVFVIKPEVYLSWIECRLPKLNFLRAKILLQIFNY